MLIADNEGLIKEIREMKIRYDITTCSLKEQIKILTEKLEEILADKEYNRCKGESCETKIAYNKIMATRAKRKKKTPVKIVEEIVE